MYILIVGGGKVGYYLAKTLIQGQHKMGVVEKNSERCNSIVNELDAIVINGDGTDIEILEDKFKKRDSKVKITFSIYLLFLF